MSQLKPADTSLAERFELFINFMEIANGYNELYDVAEVNNRFESDNQVRLQRGLETVAIDRQLLAAMAQGMPPCAGVAVGVDRLIMAIAGSHDITDVIAFPTRTTVTNHS